MQEHFIAMQILIEEMDIPDEARGKFQELLVNTAKVRDPIKLLDNRQRDIFRQRLAKKRYFIQF